MNTGSKDEFMEKGDWSIQRRGTWMGIIIPYICHSNNQLIYTAVVVSPGETVICFAFVFISSGIIIINIIIAKFQKKYM